MYDYFSDEKGISIKNDLLRKLLRTTLENQLLEQKNELLEHDLNEQMRLFFVLKTKYELMDDKITYLKIENRELKEKIEYIENMLKRQ